MRFRSKPTIVEANQFFHGATAPIGVFTREDGSCYVITIHEQETNIESGDWIILEPGSDGTRAYPCKPDIFEAKYELPMGIENELTAAAEEFIQGMAEPVITPPTPEQMPAEIWGLWHTGAGEYLSSHGERTDPLLCFVSAEDARKHIAKHRRDEMAIPVRLFPRVVAKGTIRPGLGEIDCGEFFVRTSNPPETYEDCEHACVALAQRLGIEIEVSK